MDDSDNYSKFIQSKPFKFLIGPDKIEFFVHESLVGHLSKPLDALVHGSMKEAKKGVAKIDDVDEDTFARVTEYMYTGNYSAAEFTIILDAESIAQTDHSRGKRQRTQDGRFATGGIGSGFAASEFSLGHVNGHWGTFQRSTSTWNSSVDQRKEIDTSAITPTTGQTRALQAFRSAPPARPPNTPEPPSYTPRPNKESCEDYTDIFLSHARVYVFADAYDMEGLRCLSLHKLHNCLSCFTIYQQRVQDVALLFQYTYHNTAEREGTEIDDLRRLVVHYVCCHIENLLSDDIFRATVKAESAASIDVLEGLRQRLN